jgi:hypothetical protein
LNLDHKNLPVEQVLEKIIGNLFSLFNPLIFELTLFKNPKPEFKLLFMFDGVWSNVF